MSLRERIWDTIFINGLGGLLKSWQIERTGLAEAHVQRKKMLIEAQTEMDIMKVKSGAITINDRGEMVTNENDKFIQVMLDDEKMQVLKRKVNLLKTLDKTFLLLEDKTENCDETSEMPSEEWFERWREYSEKANIEEMQELWAKILNQEIRYGGSISLRTLDFLRSISRKEAKMIEKIFTFSFYDILIYHVGKTQSDLEDNKDLFWDNGFDAILGNDENTLLTKMGIMKDTLEELQCLGIITGVDTFGKISELVSTSNDIFSLEMKIGKNIVTITSENKKDKIVLHNFKFSILGIELMKILNLDKNMEYFNLVFNMIKSLGFKVTIE